ncbi:MAG: HipA N-terminal domain-containing protein [Chitinophagaceae bacterium]|nr:HipA N-terminal domain-containing protein [Chitinophagaceae bacterium]MCW5925541.1 HipA N-terminal domain-containing protein [Chitinophagaceae bacterium]
MAKAGVYHNGTLAGILEKETADQYVFTYDAAYFADPTCAAISLSLPKSVAVHHSSVLFPFFAGLLAEGINKEIQCRLLKIDETDDFTRLLRTAGEDTIGAITIQEIS